MILGYLKKMLLPVKKVKLKMVGLDGNAFSIMGAFRTQAKREGWTTEEVDEVLSEAKSGDYSTLVSVIASYSSCPAG